jgi:hypothetical protein
MGVITKGKSRMREIRLSGSVEGVVSNHDPYSDLNLRSPSFGFLPSTKKPLFGSASEDFTEQFNQGFQTRCRDASELAFMKLTNGLIEPSEKIETCVGDAGLHYTTVVPLTLARNQAALFHAVQKASHVGIVGNHTVGNFSACQAVRFRAAQDAQHVVLSAGEAVAFEQLFGVLAQGIRGFL